MIISISSCSGSFLTFALAEAKSAIIEARPDLEMWQQRAMVEGADAEGDFHKKLALGMARLEELFKEQQLSLSTPNF